MSQPDQETSNASESQDQTMDGSHLTSKDQRSTEILSAIYTIKETVDANRGRDQPCEVIKGVKVIATEEIRHGADDPFHKRSSHQSDAIAIEDGEFQEQADRLVEDYEVVKIDTPAEVEKTVRPLMVIDAIGTRDQSDRVRDQPKQTGYESSEIEDNGYEDLIQSINSPAISLKGLRANILSYKTRPINGRKKWAIPRSTKKLREMS